MIFTSQTRQLRAFQRVLDVVDRTNPGSGGSVVAVIEVDSPLGQVVASAVLIARCWNVDASTAVETAASLVRERRAPGAFASVALLVDARTFLAIVAEASAQLGGELRLALELDGESREHDHPVVSVSARPPVRREDLN